MNINEYMVNPMGLGSSVLMLADLRKLLNDQYDELKHKISHKWFNLNDAYYIAWISIPSRSIDNMTYDVVLEFDMGSLVKGENIITKANAKVFSNCPSFTFTYANVFNKKGDMIDWLKKKYNRDIFLKDPVKRNPNELKSYERSLYFACKYITESNRNHIRDIMYKVIKIPTPTRIDSRIRKSDDILEEYNIRKKQSSDKKEKNNKTPLKSPARLKKEGLKHPKPPQTRRSPVGKKVGKVNVTRKTKKSRKI